ncbi:hypothetical protein ACMXYV_12520 [Neptuniibacter sp. SY11_33]|uniref:hypothetical protein n=1 Tax=Neptuniibacter sp. SY11_33 TaxID=3398215 RepID=UPI0039F4DE58
MEFQKVTLAALIAALMFSPVQANQEKDEEEKDSVTEWGPWALPVPTAAGPEVAINPLLFAGGSGPEHVFFDPDLDIPEDVEEGCQPGTFCGYASYYSFFRQYEEIEEEPQINGFDGGEGGEPRSKKGRPRTNFSFVPVSASFFAEFIEGDENTDGGEGYQFGVFPGGDSSLYPDIDSILLENYNSYFAYDHADEESRFDAMSFLTLSSRYHYRNGPVAHGYWLSVRTDEELFDADGAEGRTMPKFVKHAFKYINKHTGRPETISAYVGSYVFGQTSTLADLDILIDNLSEFNEGGDLIANYHGYTAMGAHVHLDVNFSNSSWGGSVNYGSDGYVSVYNSENGTSVLGQVGFNVAGGTIDGINLTAGSSQLSANDGTVTGSVTASFFGEGASHIGGVAEIVKTKGISEIESEFPQVQVPKEYGGPMYEDGTHVTTFSASHYGDDI